MPHFLCPRCASVGYSAAGESCCPNCGAPLRRANQLHRGVPRAEAVTERACSAPAAAGRFVRDTPTGIPDGSLE
jgi:uncharacterized Zn finger protein (UPF0148 family)